MLKHLKKIIKWKVDASIEAYWSQWECLSLRGKVLYKRWKSEAEDKVFWQLALPSSFRKDSLYELHTNETTGHLGEKKT